MGCGTVSVARDALAVSRLPAVPVVLDTNSPPEATMENVSVDPKAPLANRCPAESVVTDTNPGPERYTSW